MVWVFLLISLSAAGQPEPSWTDDCVNNAFISRRWVLWQHTCITTEPWLSSVWLMCALWMIELMLNKTSVHLETLVSLSVRGSPLWKCEHHGWLNLSCDFIQTRVASLFFHASLLQTQDSGVTHKSFYAKCREKRRSVVVAATGLIANWAVCCSLMCLFLEANWDTWLMLALTVREVPAWDFCSQILFFNSVRTSRRRRKTRALILMQKCCWFIQDWTDWLHEVPGE